MRIGIFTDTYYPQISGVCTSIKNLKNELEKKGHTVYIITVKVPDYIESDPHIIRVKSYKFLPVPEQRIAGISSLAALSKISHLKLDVVHTHTEFFLGFLGKLYSKRYDVPMIHTYHTMYEDYTHYITKGHYDNYAKSLAKKMSSFFCNSSDHVIAPSTKTKDKLLNYGVRKNISVIPTGIDINKFMLENDNQSEIMKKYHISNKNKVMLFIGRLAKEKSIDVIINQFAIIKKVIPDMKFLIVGDGPEKKKLINLVESLNLTDSIIFTGMIKNSEISKYYRLGKFFITASATETQGLTIIEAMASKNLVIARKDENIRNVINHNINGIIFKNESEISEFIINNYNNTNYINSITSVGSKTSFKFSSLNYANEVEEIYNRLCNNFIPEDTSAFSTRTFSS